MSDTPEPIIFVEKPEVGKRIRYTDGNRERTGALAISVDTDPEYPDTYSVQTERGDLHIGPCNTDWREPAESIRRVSRASIETAALPTDVMYGYNLGACFLAPIWGICHGYWSGLLALIPGLGLIVSGVFLARGNLWAWESGKYATLDDFRRAEGYWAIAGSISFVVLAVLWLGRLR